MESTVDEIGWKDDRSTVVVALSVSFLLHAALAALLLTLPSSSPVAVPISEDSVVTVELAPLLERSASHQPPRQIVSPSQSGVEIDPLEKAHLLSDRNNLVQKEQIKRGAGEDAAPAPGPRAPEPSNKVAKEAPEQAPAQAKPEVVKSVKQPAKAIERPAPKQDRPQARKSEERASKTEQSTSADPTRDATDEGEFRSPRVKSNKTKLALKLDSSAVLSRYSPKEEENRNLVQPESQAAAPSHYSAFSRPAGSGARFLGSSGSLDHLPNLPDGDLTLLNTKAEQFAVFVRRVAQQVFGEIRSQGWDSLGPGDIQAISDYTTVRATLGPDGSLREVTVQQGSGSRRFDAVVHEATKFGAHDRNPPPGARASDGLIHFIFQAKSWTRTGAGKYGGPVEQRWLLLGTGLE